MIGKLVATTKEILYGAAEKLPVGSTGEVVRRGIDGWIVKLDRGGEMWCKDYELQEHIPLFPGWFQGKRNGRTTATME